MKTITTLLDLPDEVIGHIMQSFPNNKKGIKNCINLAKTNKRLNKIFTQKDDISLEFKLVTQLFSMLLEKTSLLPLPESIQNKTASKKANWYLRIWILLSATIEVGVYGGYCLMNDQDPAIIGTIGILGVNLLKLAVATISPTSPVAAAITKIGLWTLAPEVALPTTLISCYEKSKQTEYAKQAAIRESHEQIKSNLNRMKQALKELDVRVKIPAVVVEVPNETTRLILKAS